MKWFAIVGYYACWMLAAAIATQIAGLLLVALLWGHVEVLRGRIDDDVLLALFPVGALLGFAAGWTTRESQKVHRACRVIGLIVGLVGITVAIVDWEKALAAQGEYMFAVWVDGFFALLFGIVAVIGILMMGMASFGAAVRRQSRSGE